MIKRRRLAFDYDAAYISRSHSDERFTYFVKRGDRASKWDWSESAWVETRT